jgi:hypothetical protein
MTHSSAARPGSAEGGLQVLKEVVTAILALGIPQAPPGTLIMGVQVAEPEMLIEIEAIAVVEPS